MGKDDMKIMKVVVTGKAEATSVENNIVVQSSRLYRD